MYECFTHLRLVHNAQTLISLILLYLIWTGWNSATELYGDLTRLGDVVRTARQAVETPSNLDDLVLEMPDHKALLHRELRRALSPNRVYIEDGHSLPIDLLTAFPEESVPIRILWQELQRQRWRVPARFTVPEDVLEDMRSWLNEWRHCHLALTQHVHGILRRLRGGQVAADRYTIPTLRIAVFGGGRRPDVVSVILQIAVYSPALRRHYCRGDSRADFYERDFDLQVTREYKRFGPLYLGVQSKEVSLPDSLFDRYHYLQRNLGEIGDQTLDEALVWAAQQQQAGIRERELRLVGASLTGEDLGVIVPLAIIALYLYMLFMLCSLNSGNGTLLDDPVPWLVAAPSPPALVWSVSTLVLLPAGATGLALWRLTTIPGGVAFVLALIQSGIAVAVYVQALRASGNLRRVSSGLSLKKGPHG